jgi:hypothetical protein
MKDIPARLQCAYCVRDFRHGGECHREKYDDIGCLAFNLDSRGCIRECDMNIKFPLYYDIPPLNMWQDGWTMKGVDTEICIIHIYGLKWDTKKGQLIVLCTCKYFVNEYSEDSEASSKPILKIVK